MNDFDAQLKAFRAGGVRRLVIVTDGVFSMDGYFAKLQDIRRLADAHDALILVDGCHATGFIGPEGSGAPALASCQAASEPAMPAPMM